MMCLIGVAGDRFPDRQNQEIVGYLIRLEKLAPARIPVLLLQPFQLQGILTSLRKYLFKVMEEKIDPVSCLFNVLAELQVCPYGSIFEGFRHDSFATDIKEKGAQGLVGDWVYIDGYLDPSGMVFIRSYSP